jgi:hypothetical protein
MSSFSFSFEIPMNSSTGSLFDSLPNVEIPYDYDCDGELKSFLFYTPDLDKNSYNELKDWIYEFVCSDCWAMTVNDEVLFNGYSTKLSFKDRMQNEWVRNQILRTPHESLLSHFPFLEKDQYIRIYMFREQPWRMNIEYKHKMKCFQVSFSQSQELYEWNEKNRLDEELDEIVQSRKNYYDHY